MDVPLEQSQMTGANLPRVMPDEPVMFQQYFAQFVTVKAVNIDTLTVDVSLDKDDGTATQPLYQNVPVIMPIGIAKQGATSKAYGHMRMPQVGTLALMLYLNGNVEHRMILGTVYYHHDADFSDIRNALLSEIEAAGDDVIVHESGTIIKIKADGTVIVQGVGNVIVNEGDKGCARVDDAVKVTLGSFDVQLLAAALLTTGAFVPTGIPPIPATTPPQDVTGAITAGSATVKVG
jgi:hypothetical protein